MKTIFDYMCKRCWKSWRDKRKFERCPYCKSKDIDIQEDTLYSE
jgi:DNA-directed RNA polymerase subunit RPC12/RpoP